MKECSIPNPCDKQWDNMTPTKAGAFCDFCKTEVFDLTNAEPEEILAYFKRAAQQKTCVKIPESKLDAANTVNWLNNVTIQKRISYAFVLAISMTFSFNANAINSDGNKNSEHNSLLGGLILSADLEDPIIMGGMIMPMSDSMGYYPVNLNFKDIYSEEGEESEVAPIFNLVLKGDTIEVSYDSPDIEKVSFTAYISVYDSIAQTYVNDTIISDKKLIEKGSREFIIHLPKSPDQAINVEMEINGIKRYGTLYMRNQFSNYPTWMY